MGPRARDAIPPAEGAYAEYAPSADLRRLVACTWVAHTAREASHPRPVLADACSDVVVIGDAAPHVAGPATRTHMVATPPGTIVVGIRFRPGAARAAFGCDAGELCDANPELRAVCGRSESALGAELSAAATTDAMRAALERWARRRLAPRADRDAGALRAAAALLVDPTLTVGALGHSLGWSARRLHREITATCGYGPKMLQRIVRMQRTLRLARRRARTLRANPLPLASLALDAGYADQAHMTRELRDLTGFTPRELLTRQRADVGRWMDELD
ncbi:MAG TPA: AraC family transcriptional regulator [Gemmatimonadaceae bacterium]|jgi:AraC-like DNA-binding protein|nr:AraC family transcriptional regulator [Gemmatimonadaceae bacterium]